MNPHRTCQENMDALKKVLTQRTLLALSRRNVEFVLAHQADSKQQLADYLRQCRAELGHIPGRTEVIGGDLIELRFRGWATALCASGLVRLELDSGATVYDALVAIGTKANITIGAQNSSYGVYVYGIGGINAGGSAGWMYSVNGAVPMVGAASYVLTNNDVVRWFCVNY